MIETSTIFAISTALGRAGVAVVRVSGPEAGAALDRMAAPRPAPRVAALRAIVDPASGEALDRGLALWFPAPASFTGEDMAEFHLHGSRAVVMAVLAALGAMPGFAMAEPGEFAWRAFDHGKIDLAEAEGLADLIDAETAAQRRQALTLAGGSLSARYEGWRADLVTASALIEAAIDFSDEGDVSAGAFREALAGVVRLEQEIAAHLADGHRGEIVREGFRVVIAGPPNAGKSSLLNALAGREAAIVSEEAGTTRDVIEVRLDLDGWPVIVTDTAGVRETEQTVEQEGIRRTVARAREADLVIWLTDARAPAAPLPEQLRGIDAPVLLVANKEDLLEGGGRGAAFRFECEEGQRQDGPEQVGVPPPLGGRTGGGEPQSSEVGSPPLPGPPPRPGEAWPRPGRERERRPRASPQEEKDLGELPPDSRVQPLSISVKTGAGLDGLVRTITRQARDRMDMGKRESPVVAQARHRRHLEAARHHLNACVTGDPSQLEFRAEDVRLAAFELGRITGRIDSEEVLGAIFGRFCIGK